MRDLYIKNGQGFLIVYSLTSRQSFQDIKLIREQILRVKGSDRVPIVLAANKCDVIEPQREVSTDEGCNLAREWGIPYIETSAKNSYIVNSLFTEIVKEMNTIANSNYYGYGRKDKKHKKLKKLTLNNSSNNNSNKTMLTNHLSASYASSDLTAASAKFKELNSDSDDASGFFSSCCRIFCCSYCCCSCCTSSHNNSSSSSGMCGGSGSGCCCSKYGSSQKNINSCNSSYDNEHSEKSCSLM